MRITLNLGLYFHDHRSIAKIFVSKKMKFIKDVEEHISSIFNINNFYLKCENQYLPPEEDAQILQYDDIVWVIPVTDQVLEGKIQEEVVTVLKKKKKKKKHDDIKEEEKLSDRNEKQTENEHMEVVDDTPIKTKKKKKRLINCDPPLEKVEYGNVTKRRKLKSPCSDTETVKDSGQDTLSSKSEDFDNKDVNVKFLVSSFESKASVDLHCEPKEPEKRINIVKTIIISKKPNDNSKLVDTELNQKESNSKAKNQSADILSSFETSSIACSSISEADNKVNKRRRKRTRKPRVKQEQQNTTFEKPFYEYVHNPVVAQTPVHLRFNEDTESPTVDEIQNNEVKNDVKIDTDCIHKDINVEKLDKNISQASNEMKKDEPNHISIINLESSSCEIENCILKQPITENVEPKLDDVIAFKILRMSENYTPEISSTIVGKVVDYTPEDKQITFNIMYGQQQCLLPNGKFSLDPEEQQSEDEKYRCLWSNLLEPRLLYP